MQVSGDSLQVITVSVINLSDLTQELRMQGRSVLGLTLISAVWGGQLKLCPRLDVALKNLSLEGCDGTVAGTDRNIADVFLSYSAFTTVDHAQTCPVVSVLLRLAKA